MGKVEIHEEGLRAIDLSRAMLEEGMPALYQHLQSQLAGVGCSHILNNSNSHLPHLDIHMQATHLCCCTRYGPCGFVHVSSSLRLFNLVDPRNSCGPCGFVQVSSSLRLFNLVDPRNSCGPCGFVQVSSSLRLFNLVDPRNSCGPCEFVLVSTSNLSI
ncbi:hypothetical protein J6590_039132 [Homalodisca vitripennis]|nr:hypothetical protein J6590_039132 [Homalodisca vitripennis]